MKAPQRAMVPDPTALASIPLPPTPAKGGQGGNQVHSPPTPAQGGQGENQLHSPPAPAEGGQGGSQVHRCIQNVNFIILDYLSTALDSSSQEILLPWS